MLMSMMTADDAAARLGIKVQSLYAYVSRGLVERHLTDDGRSMFDSHSIESLAARGRPRLSSRQSSLNLMIQTELTLIDSHRIWFRGHEATSLARTHTFEQVAELLWSGELPPLHEPWAGTTVVRPDGVGPADSLRITAACAAAADPLRANLERAAVAATGRHLVASMVDSLADGRADRVPSLTLRDGTRVRGSIAGRLWAALAPQRPRPGMVEVLNAILVLLADHELAASTLAARVAASARADPYSVVGAGLATVNGVLHGQASSYARRVLDDADEMGAGPAITIAMRTWQKVPGFGQPLYPEGDPRAVLILSMLRDALGASRALSTADAVISALRRRTDTSPNVDLALGVFTQAARMPSDCGEAIFSIARTAGWLAHGIEEYSEQPLRFRPRAAYTGKR